MPRDSGPSRLSLKPLSTIVSPPSPIDAKVDHLSRLPIVASNQAEEHNGEPEDRKDSLSAPETTYDSPEEDEDLDGKTDRQAEKLSAGPSTSSPHRSDSQSNEPKPSQSLAPVLPASPKPSSHLLKPDDMQRSPSNTSLSSYPSSRSASPSSPQYRMKGLHHRRTSSTHRVRETIAAEKTNTPDGQRMVNQYRIGKSLGRGGYATVELAKDVGTGIEYVSSKELRNPHGASDTGLHYFPGHQRVFQIPTSLASSAREAEADAAWEVTQNQELTQAS